MKRCSLIILTLLFLVSLNAFSFAEETAILQLATDISEGYGGDTVTLSLYLSADNLGGMQTGIQWNEGYLTYVEGSAAFADGFAESAELSLINDSASGSIRLVYGNTSGYTAENEAIFTAEFLLSDDVSGLTTFGFSDTKLTDATEALAVIQPEIYETSVHTLIYDAGSVELSLSPDNWSPFCGDTVTVSVNVSSYTSAVGSLQGTIAYNPSVIEYVADSAAFSETAAETAFTQIINANTAGELKFVYGSLTGCPEGTLFTMQFKVIGAVDSYSDLIICDAKATNAETDRLSLMNCYCYIAYLYIQKQPDVLYYTSSIRETGVFNGEPVTLRISADGIAMGGLQASISYNPDQLEYIADSAAFTDAFAENASISMINDSTSGIIRLIYSNVSGYTPDGSDIFTAQFIVRKCGFELDPFVFSDVKTTNASAESLIELESVFQHAIDWTNVLAGHNSVLAEAVQPTCTEPGLTEGWYCSACGEVFVAQESIPAYGHTEVIDDAVNATCTESGLTQGSHCSTCGEVVTAQEVIPPTGHSILMEERLFDTTVGNEISVRIRFLCGHAADAAVQWTSADPERLSLIQTAADSESMTAVYAIHSPCVSSVSAEFADGFTASCTCIVIAHSDQQMVLPAALQTIEPEAFAGSSVQEVILPEGIERIGDRAFAGCADLAIIHLPDSLSFIAESAFEGSDHVAFICSAESAAADFAISNGIAHHPGA